jgi:hypothetical protein
MGIKLNKKLLLKNIDPGNGYFINYLELRIELTN